MSRAAERIAREQQISVFNWMLTLLISIIPGVNLIVWLAWLFMPVKKMRKRFALAALLLTILLAIAFFACFMAWGPQIVAWLESIQPAVEAAA